MITRLLVANRGEIARRVFRSCRQAGIGCVAVYSDPDTAAPHAREADAAVRLPGSSPADTYLNGPALVNAALAASADAVHPGYGFLAEDAGFARAVTAAGLLWVGPPAAAIEAMGSKINARKLAASAGVPVLPELDPESITTFPVLVKASGGGGGRGIREVRGPAELQAALQAAGREARSAFGDATVFCEPLMPAARHIEVQVLADAYGTVWTLTERDCSIQRRYQKVIECSPAPGLSPRLRERLFAAAEAVTATVSYRGAGTAEFLVDPAGQFFFLEFNTRLQVEHPVTECLHGIDLVALQLDIAQDVALPARPPPPAGHAIEARLYAEDPVHGYRPASGTMHTLHIPGVDVRFTGPAGPAAAGLRLDSGVESGSEISPHYDPMLAKLIAWAPTRSAAARRLADALERARIHGPVTNRALLASVLRGERFLAGQADTALLADYDLAGLGPAAATVTLAAVAAGLADAAASHAAARVAASLPCGWRNVVSQPQRKSFEHATGRIEMAYLWTRDGIRVVDPTAGPGLAGAGLAGAGPGQARAGLGLAAPGPGQAGAGAGLADLEVAEVAPDHVLLRVSGVRYRFDVARAGGEVFVDSALGAVALTPVPRLPALAATAAPGSLVAPMPGNVVRIEVTPGTRVRAGQPVLVLEAMKMEHQILAPADGRLDELRVAPGTQVETGTVLAIVTTEDA